MSDLPLLALGEARAFRCDPRFAPLPAQDPDSPDPLARAWAEGHSAGLAEANAAAAARAEADAAARGQIELTLARLDAEQAEALRQRLQTAVELLCESAIAPLALDRAALAARVARAAAMLARADDDKVLRLHPDDLALVARNLPEGLETIPDPSLERGALRIETATGGVEDGPAHWRRAITEALSLC
jgi:flagellar assembly protein FliH